MLGKASATLTRGRVSHRGKGSVSVVSCLALCISLQHRSQPAWAGEKSLQVMGNGKGLEVSQQQE